MCLCVRSCLRVCVCVRVGRDSVGGRAQCSLHRYYTRCKSPIGHDLFYACMREGGVVATPEPGEGDPVQTGKGTLCRTYGWRARAKEGVERVVGDCPLSEVRVYVGVS